MTGVFIRKEDKTQMHAQSEDHVKTPEEESHLQARERDL